MQRARVLGDGRAFGDALGDDLEEATGLSVAVAFAKESGLSAVDLEAWCREGRRLRVLAGTDFFLTELPWLQRLSARPGAECKVFHAVGRVRGFHPKLYVIDKPDRRVVYIGSSNFTRGGLADNVEVNVRLEGPAEASEIREAAGIFDRLFHDVHATAIREEFAERYRELQAAQQAMREYAPARERRDALLVAERMLIGAYRAQETASGRWLLVTTEENLAAYVRHGVWARRSDKDTLGYERGDVFFFHVTKGRGIAAFGMFTGEPYRDDTPIEGAGTDRAYPWRIPIEVLGVLRGGVDTRNVLGALRKDARPKWLSGFVQKSHTLDPADFAALQKAFEDALRAERSANPRRG